MVFWLFVVSHFVLSCEHLPVVLGYGIFRLDLLLDLLLSFPEFCHSQTPLTSGTSNPTVQFPKPYIHLRIAQYGDTSRSNSFKSEIKFPDERIYPTVLARSQKTIIELFADKEDAPIINDVGVI
jgi:hypothetical protein